MTWSFINDWKENTSFTLALFQWGEFSPPGKYLTAVLMGIGFHVVKWDE